MNFNVHLHINYLSLPLFGVCVYIVICCLSCWCDDSEKYDFVIIYYHYYYGKTRTLCVDSSLKIEVFSLLCYRFLWIFKRNIVVLLYKIFINVLRWRSLWYWIIFSHPSTKFVTHIIQTTTRWSFHHHRIVLSLVWLSTHW